MLEFPKNFLLIDYISQFILDYLLNTQIQNYLDK